MVEHKTNEFMASFSSHFLKKDQNRKANQARVEKEYLKRGVSRQPEIPKTFYVTNGYDNEKFDIVKGICIGI